MSLSGRDDSSYVDVHSITSLLNSTYSDILSQFKGESTLNDFASLADDIVSTYEFLLGNINGIFLNIKKVMTKMFDRCSASADRMYIDRDLVGGLNIFLLLKATWVLVEQRKSYKELAETLQEMGMLCTQGDSHRLFLLFLSIQHD